MTTECMKCEIAENDAIIEKYRLKKEDEFLSKADAIFDDYRKDHAGRVKSYVFKCQIWGNFLNVYVEDRGVKYETAINLSNVVNIDFITGHDVDREGEIYYVVNRANDDEKKNDDISFQNKLFEPLSFAKIPTRCVISTIGGQSAFTWWNNMNFLGKTTKNYPRYSKDDRIVFKNTDFNLSIPYGLGHNIYLQIIKSKDSRK